VLSAPIPSVSFGHVRWEHHARGRLKYNIDATFFTTLNRTCIGICFKDGDGAFVLAKTMSFVDVYLVDVGEALDL